MGVSSPLLPRGSSRFAGASSAHWAILTAQDESSGQMEWRQDAYGILTHLFNKYSMNTYMCLTELSTLGDSSLESSKLDIDRRDWMALSGQRSKEG